MSPEAREETARSRVIAASFLSVEPEELELARPLRDLPERVYGPGARAVTWRHHERRRRHARRPTVAAGQQVTAGEEHQVIDSRSLLRMAK